MPDTATTTHPINQIEYSLSAVDLGNTGPSGNSKTRTRASVIVVNYNGRAYLDACLASLLAAWESEDEIILVDNASIDGSADHVTATFSRVRVIRNEHNAGFAAGSNLGAQYATGSYLAFLNPDTEVEPGWLNALVDALEQDPRIGLVTSKILILNDPERVNTCGNVVHCTGLTQCRGLNQEHEAFNEQIEVDAVSGAAFAIRRELFERLGGFDDTFFMYMEDTDLSWRARLASYRCLFIPQSVVYHDYRLRFGPSKVFYQERNRHMMLLKTLRWRTLLTLLPALLLGEIVTWGFSLLRDRQNWTNKLRAYVWVIRHWKQIMAARKRVQASRQVSDRDLVTQFTHRLDFEQTGDGALARLAHFTFDPLFYILQRLAWILIA